MIVIECSGGLGNQMFEYALALKYEYLGRNVYLDVSGFRKKCGIRKWELGVFEARDTAITIISDNIVSNVCVALFRKMLKYEDEVVVYQPEIINYKYKYLSGYWQNECYFKDIENKIRDSFSFDSSKISSTNIKIGQEMVSSNSVSLHVRRGDYLNFDNCEIYGQVCNKDYYLRAIKYMEEEVDNPIFYLFSDDVEWVRENIYRENMTIIEWNRGDDSWQDMYLMSRCRHHIIANSTFSWWGAWLGDYDKKIVIAPKRWFNHNDCVDIICPEWVRC